MAINKSTVMARMAFVAAAVLVAAILTAHIAHAQRVEGRDDICQYGPSPRPVAEPASTPKSRGSNKAMSH